MVDEDRTAQQQAGNGDQAQDEAEITEENWDARTIELTINGEKRTLTAREAFKLAEKAEGAEKRFRDAAALASRAQKGVRIQDLLDAGSANQLDDNGMTELCGLLGVNPQDLATDTEDETMDEGATDAGSAGAQEQRKPITVADLDPSLQAQLKAAHDVSVTNYQEQWVRAIDGAIQSDTVLQERIAGDTGRNAAIRQLVTSEVNRRVLAGQKPGPELLQASVQQARTIAKAFESGVATPGLGPAPTMPPGFQAGKPPKRVSVQDPDYTENLVHRTLATQAKHAQE